jgi:hypothetical protein
MEDDEKKPYQLLANEDKERYKKEKQEFEKLLETLANEENK